MGSMQKAKPHLLPQEIKVKGSLARKVLRERGGRVSTQSLSKSKTSLLSDRSSREEAPDQSQSCWVLYIHPQRPGKILPTFREGASTFPNSQPL